MAEWLGHQSVLTTKLELSLGRPLFNSWATFWKLQVAAFFQLGFLTMLCLFALFISSFGFYGPEKSHWESGQLRYLFISLCKKNCIRAHKARFRFLILVPRASVSFGHMVGDFKTSSTGVENWASFQNCRRLLSSNLPLSRLHWRKICKNRLLSFFFTCLLPLATNSSSVPVSGILTWVPWSGFWYKDGQQLIGFLKRYSHISGKSIFSDVV